jgi:hypothetical protein
MAAIIEGDEDEFMRRSGKLFHCKSDFSLASNSILLHIAEESRHGFTRIAWFMHRDEEMSVSVERKVMRISILSAD